MSRQSFIDAKARMDAITVATNVRYYIRHLMTPTQAKYIMEVLGSPGFNMDEAIVKERMGQEVGEQFIDNALEHADELVVIARIVLAE